MRLKMLAELRIKNQPGISVWQRSFFERIIRDDTELWNKRQYVRNNPMNHWLKKIKTVADLEKIS